MLWIALYLPDLALQIAARSEHECTTKAQRRPLVIQHGPANRPLVFAANTPARSMGIEPAMPVAGAQALINDLLVQTRDPKREDVALHNLALWAGQFTPVPSRRVSRMGGATGLCRLSHYRRVFRVWCSTCPSRCEINGTQAYHRQRVSAG